MPTSIEQVQEFLDEYELRYRIDAEHDAILIGFEINPDETSFRNPDGSAAVRMVIRVMEHGEFLAVFCPQAWNVAACPHKQAVFEAIAAIQSQYKLLRFDYDGVDGEIRPNVELPLEDSEITSRQFHRLIHGVLHGVQRYDGVIRHAMETGEVSFASVERMEARAASSPEIARLQQLAEEIGGIEELERLAAGDDIGPLAEGFGLAGDGDSVIDESSADDLIIDSDEDSLDESAAEQPSDPQPVIRRIWEQLRSWRRLFGPNDPQAEGKRKAG